MKKNAYWDSSFRIANRYMLLCRNRIPVGARLYTLIQAGHVANLATFTNGTKSFPVVNQLGRGTDRTPTPL